MADKQRKKPKNYYVDYSKKSKYGRPQKWTNTSSGEGNARYRETPEITLGQKGFLVTSITGYEVKCYSEVRQLLEDYYQELYSDTSNSDKGHSTCSVQEEPKLTSKLEGGDDDNDLDLELEELKHTKRRFRQVKTHCKNVIFFVTSEECRDVDHDLIVRKIFRDIEESKSQKTRYTFKLFPIMTTFNMSIPGAKEAVARILKESFSEDSQHELSKKEEVKYFIEIQMRGNYKLDQDQRMRMIEGMGGTVSEIKPNWKVDRENADLILLVIALREVCCVTFVMDYFKLCKYNIVEWYRKNLEEFDDLTVGTTHRKPAL